MTPCWQDTWTNGTCAGYSSAQSLCPAKSEHRATIVYYLHMTPHRYSPAWLEELTEDEVHECLAQAWERLDGAEQHLIKQAIGKLVTAVSEQAGGRAQYGELGGRTTLAFIGIFLQGKTINGSR